MGRPFDMGALVQSADEAAADPGRLATLVRRCWPAASDATLPAARDWISRWGPARLTAQAPECACAAGTCAWCN